MPDSTRWQANQSQARDPVATGMFTTFHAVTPTNRIGFRSALVHPESFRGRESCHSKLTH
jgi:hypothetical protein